MWSAWLKLKTYHRRPSDELELTDSIAVYCVDSTVLWFGTKIENMLNERVNKGSPKEPKWEDKYTLEQLLDPLFHPPKPLPTLKTKVQPAPSGLAALMAMVGESGGAVKLWGYVGPDAKPN